MEPYDHRNVCEFLQDEKQAIATWLKELRWIKGFVADNVQRFVDIKKLKRLGIK